MNTKVEITENRLRCIESALTNPKLGGWTCVDYILGCFCARDLHSDTTWLGTEFELICMKDCSTYTKISELLKMYDVWADHIIRTLV